MENDKAIQVAGYVQGWQDAKAECAAGPWVEGQVPEDGEWYNFADRHRPLGAARFDSRGEYWLIGTNGSGGHLVSKHLPFHTRHARINTGERDDR